MSNPKITPGQILKDSEDAALTIIREKPKTEDLRMGELIHLHGSNAQAVGRVIGASSVKPYFRGEVLTFKFSFSNTIPEKAPIDVPVNSVMISLDDRETWIVYDSKFWGFEFENYYTIVSEAALVKKVGR